MVAAGAVLGSVVKVNESQAPTNTVLRVPFLPSHRLAYEACNLRLRGSFTLRQGGARQDN